MDARKANDRIAAKAEQLRFVSRVPMLCECSAPGCRTIVMVALSDYREIRATEDSFLTAPGHAAERAGLESRTADYYEVHQGGRSRDEDDGSRRRA
ncbi:MAG TPA: hypothetical protein VH541_03485 [Gaiellaceae bacterium]|jgi:hypothetical protein